MMHGQKNIKLWLWCVWEWSWILNNKATLAHKVLLCHGERNVVEAWK